MKKTFTLVEIVVSVVIVAIISAISALALKQWLVSSRDQQRLLDIKSIQYGLKNFYNSNNYYPLPSDNLVSIIASGFVSNAGYQGSLGEINKRDLNLKGTFFDPLTKEYYIYFVNSDQSKYQIISFMEGEKYKIGFNNGVYAALNYSKYKPKSFGSNLGIILKKDTLLPLNLIITGNFDISAANNVYDAYISDDDILVGTGNSFLNLVQFAKNGYEQPKVCPVGFIPVLGNKDFQQAGFCAAKYEMKQASGDAGSRNGPSSSMRPVGSAIEPYCSGYVCNNTVGGLTGGIKGIVSKPDGYPMVWINQYNAIQACLSMGSGYHLIMDKERMTIARNIESVSQNRGTGKFLNNTVDYYGINRGETNEYPRQTSIPGALPADSEYGLSGSIVDNDFRSRRIHFLSNGQIVRDFAGNVREHVNFANTLDGSGYYLMNSIICSGAAGSYSFSKNSAESLTECEFINGYSIEKNGPKNIYLNRTNGIGFIYSNTVASRILIRSSSWLDRHSAGIYIFYFGRGITSSGPHVGFRCAY